MALKVQGSQPRPNSSDISRLEQIISRPLPNFYRRFLDNVNGGHPQPDTFYSASGNAYSVNNFFFVGGDSASTDSLAWNYINRWAGIPAQYLPIARDGGDNLFMIDVGFIEGSEVWYWAHDEPENNLIKIAESFEIFVDGLRDNPDYI